MRSAPGAYLLVVILDRRMRVQHAAENVSPHRERRHAVLPQAPLARPRLPAVLGPASPKTERVAKDPPQRIVTEAVVPVSVRACVNS
jgi:hypothetical protein